MQLAAGQHRLEHVAGVHRGVATGARTDDRVQLVDERDDLPAGVLDLLEHGLEPLLELAAVLRAGDHRGQVEASTRRPLRESGTSPATTALGQSLDDGGLADAGLTDQDRVVLGTPRQHLHDPADLGVTADHRVEPALLARPAVRSTLYFSSASYVDSASWLVTRRLPRTAVRPSRSPSAVEPGVGEQLLRRRLDRGERDEQVLGGDVVVLHRGGEVERGGQHRVSAGGRGRLLHGAPLARGSAPTDLLGCAVSAATSTPALATRCAPCRRPAGAARPAGGSARSRVAGGGGGELPGLDGLPAAGGELVGSELAQGAPPGLGVRHPDVVALRRSSHTTPPRVESVPLNFARPKGPERSSDQRRHTRKKGVHTCPASRISASRVQAEADAETRVCRQAPTRTSRGPAGAHEPEPGLRS